MKKLSLGLICWLAAPHSYANNTIVYTPQPLEVSDSLFTTCSKTNTYALTFDDGPAEATETVLDTLAQYKVKATFFVVGARLGDAAYSRSLRRAFDEGHLIGNHTWTHPDDLRQLNDDEIIAQVNKTDEAIEKIIGVRPIYMRPPNGLLDERVYGLLKAMNHRVVLWNINSYDWKYWPEDLSLILKTIQTYVTQGSPNNSFISLHHDLWPVAMAQVPEILEYLLPRFSLERVDSCMSSSEAYFKGRPGDLPMGAVRF